MKLSGIYEIVHVPSGCRYIGGSHDCRRRWIRHRNRLKCGRHSNRPLQAAYDADGLDSLTFRFVEAVSDPLVVHLREAAHLELAKARGAVFNIKRPGTCIENLRASNIGKHAMTDDQRAALGEANRTWRPTDAMKQQIRLTHLGKKKTPAHRAKLAAHLLRVRADPTGHKRSAETRALQAEAARLSWANGKRRAAQQRVA